MPLHVFLADRIRREGPLTVAAFMELALYHPEGGYYASAAQRSGRAGDFYTSVDVGPLFGELLSTFVHRAWRALAREAHADTPFTLCEAGAGNGRLARDILDTLERETPEGYTAASLALVERSAQARAVQASTLGHHAARLAWSADRLPGPFDGVLIANELLDAMPVHRVARRPGGWREQYVDLSEGRLVLREGPLSTPRLAAHFDRVGIDPPVGSVADVSLAAVDWIHEAARALHRGWVVVIDYGHQAQRLYGGRHGDGTLRGFRAHRVDASARPEDDACPPWIDAPGDQDLTAHVDFTAIAGAARDAGLEIVAGPMEQVRFLVGLGLGERLAGDTGTSLAEVKRRLAAQALASPEGLGGSHQVLVLGRDVTGMGFGL